MREKAAGTIDIGKSLYPKSKEIRVLAFFKARPGNNETLENILLSLIEPTRKEPGNIAYILCRQDDDPHSLMFDEIWTDRDSLDRHLKMPYIVSMLKQIESLVEAPAEIYVYREVKS